MPLFNNQARFTHRVSPAFTRLAVVQTTLIITITLVAPK
jgi:hypothetical protein